VQAYHKFKNRGVTFASLTNMPRASVEQFVDRFAVPWPCAFGTPTKLIAQFGAFNRDSAIQGYEVRPTLYLIGANGRVLWSDGQARTKHQEPGIVVHQLEDEIEKALASGKSEIRISKSETNPKSE
jgi:hypothetical protein